MEFNQYCTCLIRDTNIERAYGSDSIDMSESLDMADENSRPNATSVVTTSSNQNMTSGIGRTAAADAGVVVEEEKSSSASSSRHSSIDPRVQWMQNCVVKLLSREFTAAEMVAFFTELNNSLINLLNDTEKFKYIFICRTVQPIPSRLDDDDFIETRKVGKYLQFEVDKMMDRTPIDLYVLYFRRKKPGYVQVEVDEDTAHEKYTEYLKVGILNQVGCLKDPVKRYINSKYS